MTPEKFILVCGTLSRGACVIDSLGNWMRRKPLLGGAFGSGGYSLQSNCSTDEGLHSVTYFVIHEPSLSPIGIGLTKAEALSGAREFLAWLEPVPLEIAYRRAMEAVAKRRADLEVEKAKRSAERVERFRAEAPAPKVPKRRRAIFEKSGGKCHYCGATLSLDGRWHIEHKMPRALLGGSEQSNLVAACVSCNLRKKDRTDLEFIAAEKRSDE